MIYSTSDVARQARPSLESATANLQRASERVRAGLKLEHAAAPQYATDAQPSFGAPIMDRVESAVRQFVKPEISAADAGKIAAEAARNLATQYLSMANAQPQALRQV